MSPLLFYKNMIVNESMSGQKAASLNADINGHLFTFSRLVCKCEKDGYMYL